MESKDQQAQSKKALNADSVGCELSRRQFLGGCAACAAGLAGISALSAIPVLAQPPASNEKTKVRLVFTHIPPQTPTWPNIGYNYEGRKKELIEKLSKGCPGIEFLPATVQNQDEAKKLLEADKEVDGYLIYMIGIWTGAPQVIAASGRPTIFVDDLYGGSGEFLVAYSSAKRQGLKVAGVSSAKFDDVIQAARCFECIKKLQSSVILRLGGGFGCSAKGVQDVFGTKVVEINYDPLNELYNKADKDEARKCAQRWTKQAEKIVEPSHQEIEKSAAMYLAMRELMNQNKARAITINCLGGFYGGHITAYPCLGFFQFNNDGFVGACEGDLTSTISMLLMGYLVGRPGYISDPVIDTSKNQIIYAHCVAPSKVFGPDGPANPYHIRSHSEDRKGACVRSLMPLGEMTTTLEFNPDSHKVIIHQGKTVANIDEDKACRTKLAAEPKGSIDKLLKYWDQWGWHRVTFYGDLKRPVEHISALLGFEVIEEA
jgi:hypothetical protein